MVIFAALAALVAGDAKARDDVAAEPVRLAPAYPAGKTPLPQPRPATAPDDQPRSSDHDVNPDIRATANPSPCRQALTEDVAIAPSVPPIRGPGACGGDDLVRLEAVVLPDKRRIAVKPAAVLRCTMASALANWIRSDIAPLADSHAMQLSELDNFDSFECRGRNRIASAKLSEHGRANALDVRGLKLADGRMLSLTDRNAARDVRETIRASACARFMTVLGPGSDGYHENHIHLDLAERRNGYRICQWDIETAPAHQIETATSARPMPLPAARPEQAPSRDAPGSHAVEQVKVQPAKPPPVSLSPIPLAQQPADVARPITRKGRAHRQTAAPAATAKSTDGRALTAGGPAAASKETKAEPNDKARDRGGRDSVAAPKPSAGDAKPAVADARRAKRRHRKSRARQRPPDLPQLLKRMFD